MVIRPVQCVVEPIEVIMKTEEEVVQYFNENKLFRALDDNSFVKKSHIMSKLQLKEVTILYNRGKSRVELRMQC